MASATIKQGNTGPLWRVGVPERDGNGVLTGAYVDLSGAGWACQVKCESATVPIDRAAVTLSSDNTRFLVQLTPTETDLLEPEAHTVAIEVVNPNTTPPFKVETHEKLVVEKDII